MANYTITTGNDDFWTSQPDGGSVSTDYTSTTLTFGRNNFVSPGISINAYGDVNTDAIPDTDTITAATLYFYMDSYTSSRRVAKTFFVRMLKADETNYVSVGSGTFVSAGWYSLTLPSGILAEIDKVGKTLFHFGTEDPGGANVRAANLRAYEYDVDHTYAMYLDVTHAAPSSLTPSRTLLGAGL